ncbi:hypothetical protein NOF04DRAFT_1272824 [Fusarium oxysporum II5]|nr:hypothetical protein NOF04DRAFT_1272824 [Fusarium oxysporum II5]
MQDTEVKTVVLVLGLPRCGTTSIAAALQADSLGIKSVLHASETAKHPARCEDILVALRYQDDDDIISRHSRICRATEGYAACAESLNALAEDLMDLYPDAKLILNIRPPSIPGETEGISWARSCKNTISFFTSPWVFNIDYRRMYGGAKGYSRTNSPVFFEPKGSSWMTAGFYDKYVAWVKIQARKRNRSLLTWHPGMGWSPLCEFLEKEAPPTGTPLPFLNECNTSKVDQNAYLKRGIMIQSMIILIFSTTLGILLFLA